MLYLGPTHQCGMWLDTLQKCGDIERGNLIREQIENFSDKCGNTYWFSFCGDSPLTTNVNCSSWLVTPPRKFHVFFGSNTTVLSSHDYACILCFRITFFISTWVSDADTHSTKLFAGLTQTLDEMKTLLEDTAANKL